MVVMSAQTPRPSDPWPYFSRPTARQVIWFWRVRQGLPSQPFPVVELIADRFAFAELLHDVWDRPMVVDGLGELMMGLREGTAEPVDVMEQLAALSPKVEDEVWSRYQVELGMNYQEEETG